MRLKAQAAQGGTVTVACINQAKTPMGVSFKKMIRALQKCYGHYFKPVWGYTLKLYITDEPKPSDWQLIFFDESDDAEALGYHDLTKDGQPVSKVFVKSTLDDGQLVSVTACHELFEMAIDPLANLWAEAPNGVEYAYEMCDAVENDTFEVDGVVMSNFVHPSWFEPFDHPPGTKYDHLGLLTAPFTMTHGGYCIIKKNGRVTEIFASKEKKAQFKKEDRRGHRSEYRKPVGEGLVLKQARRKR